MTYPQGARTASPAAERNKQPILDVLQRQLPKTGTVLEIASGTGQHVVHFAAGLPNLTFQPSDPDPAAVAAISFLRHQSGLSNIRAPLLLDVCAQPWALPAPIAAIVNCNMVHISPFAASQALFAEAGHRLPEQGVMVMYGPFRHHGEFTAESNQAFDESLKSRNPAWGIRDVDEMAALANDNHLHLAETIEMPANNHCLVFHR